MKIITDMAVGECRYIPRESRLACQQLAGQVNTRARRPAGLEDAKLVCTSGVLVLSVGQVQHMLKIERVS